MESLSKMKQFGDFHDKRALEPPRQESTGTTTKGRHDRGQDGTTKEAPRSWDAATTKRKKKNQLARVG